MRRIALVVVVGTFVSACAGGDVATTTVSTIGVLDDAGSATTPDPLGRSPVGSATTTTIVESDPVMSDALRAIASNWNTDFGIRSIDLDELLVGIPARDPRDLIPPIDEPEFETVEEGREWLSEDEPGILLAIDDDARWYPLSILHRHEIVNDTVGGIPIAVTYCPLCNTAVAFDRRVGGDQLRMGVSGLLRNSDLVMWDDSTESLWQQITGEAIVGALTGTKLESVPSAIVRFADAAGTHADLRVLGRDQGFGITYGRNPYVGYSSRPAPLPFFEAPIDDRLPPLERVVGVTIENDHLAVPFSVLVERPAINVDVGGTPIVVMWGAPMTTDALDSFEVGAGEAIGSALAHLAVVDGMPLTFRSESGRFVDLETGSTWTLLGEAVDGPLSGTTLELAPHRNEFWFAWQAFFPGGTLITGP